jgi:hypothetical protein
MFSKFSRYISVELNLPKRDRCSDGATFVENCRQEYNRMLEQSPSIPDDILLIFNRKYKHSLISKPVIAHIEEIKIFKDINGVWEERRKQIEKIKYLKHQDTIKHIKNNNNLLTFKLPDLISSRGLDDSSEDDVTDRRLSDDQINIEMREIKVDKDVEEGHHEEGHHKEGHHRVGHHEVGHHEVGHHEVGHHREGHHEVGHHKEGHHKEGHHKEGHYDGIKRYEI